MAKRIFQGVVLFFALYAFVFLPLGKKSALEHIRAIWATPAAQQAASEVKGGVTRLVRRLENEARQTTESSDRGLEPGEADGDAAERDDAAKGAFERKSAERKTAERQAARRDALERNLGEREEAAPPRSVPSPRPRALSAEKPARDRL
jgi:hypothetical protein